MRSAARRGAGIAFRAVARDRPAHRAQPPQHVHERRFSRRRSALAPPMCGSAPRSSAPTAGAPSEAPAKSHHAGACPGSGGRFGAVLDGTRHTGTKIEAYRECQYGYRRAVVGPGQEAERAASDRRASKGSPANRFGPASVPRAALAGRHIGRVRRAGPAWCGRDRDRRSQHRTIGGHFPLISRLRRLSGYFGCKKFPVIAMKIATAGLVSI